jgi:FtsP/CotA-like multicopper oxidase with cupredoxin domain
LPCWCCSIRGARVPHEIDGRRFAGAVRDTVLVPPRRRVVIAFDANNPGLWALHCHLLYHLDAGMFTTLRYV